MPVARHAGEPATRQPYVTRNKKGSTGLPRYPFVTGRIPTRPVPRCSFGWPQKAKANVF
jgi:hypothetical protein